MNDEITHMGVVDRLLRLGLPGNQRRFVIRVDADDIELVEIAEMNAGQRRQLAAEHQMEQLLVVLSHFVFRSYIGIFRLVCGIQAQRSMVLQTLCSGD